MEGAFGRFQEQINLIHVIAVVNAEIELLLFGLGAWYLRLYRIHWRKWYTEIKNYKQGTTIQTVVEDCAASAYYRIEIGDRIYKSYNFIWFESRDCDSQRNIKVLFCTMCKLRDKRLETGIQRGVKAVMILKKRKF